jgi:glucosamine--fructose-6-phosphate aminotransferase (isomerizing)
VCRASSSVSYCPAEMTSILRETMEGQPDALRRLIGDPGPAELAARRLAGRRVLLVGTGTSWHAAGHGAALLRLAGLEAWPLAALDVALEGPTADPASDALVVLSHTGAKRYSARVLEQARAAGVPTVAIGGIGAPGTDVETVEPERSDTYTASHLGALLRLAQLAEALGASLGGSLADVPAAVARALTEEREPVVAPARLLELIGGGSNAWTAAEGALKAREAAYVATEGLAVEQYVHGPSVAVGAGDTLVVLDGGGLWSARLEEAAQATSEAGARVHRIAVRSLGEPLSIFPLTAAVQRIALELSKELGTDPDTFGAELPGHERWASLEF